MTRAQELRNFWKMFYESLPDEIEDESRISAKEIAQALSQVIESLDFADTSFKPAILEIIVDLNIGIPLRRAITKHDFFSPMEELLIRYGELMGNVELEIQRIALSPNVFTRSKQLDLFWEIILSGTGRIPQIELVRLAIAIFGSEFKIKAQMEELIKSIGKGSLLSEAISQVPLFSQFEVATIVAGEDNGNLDQALWELTKE